MYYKATVTKSIENFWLNPKTGEYEGTDPDTSKDLGQVEEITAPSKKELKDKIESSYGKIEHDIENTYSYVCEGEYLYSVPAEDRIPFLETYTVEKFSP